MLKDVQEAVECTKEFSHPTHNDVVCKLLIIDKLLEAKASAVDEQLDLLAKLFKALCTASPSPVISGEELQAGLLRTCNAVADASLDAPSCPSLVAKLLARLVGMECIHVEILQAILVEQVRHCAELCTCDDGHRRSKSMAADHWSDVVTLQDLVEFGTAAKMVTDVLVALKDTEVSHKASSDINTSPRTKELSAPSTLVACYSLWRLQGVGEEGLKQMLAANPLDFSKFNPGPPVSATLPAPYVAARHAQSSHNELFFRDAPACPDERTVRRCRPAIVAVGRQGAHLGTIHAGLDRDDVHSA